MARINHRPNPDTRKIVSEQMGVVSKMLGSSYVSYHPLLVTATGSVKAALFLSHAIAWSSYLAKKRPDREGWFYLRSADWQEGTGLSAREQVTARNTLKSMGILSEKRVGVPAQNWYKLDLDRLGHHVAKATGREFTTWTWDRAVMLRLLGQPIPCHRVLIRVAGGVIGGMILSYLYRAARRDLSSGTDGGWMHVPIAHSRKMLGISTKQQRKARADLRRLGLIEEEYESVAKPKLLTKLDFGRLGQMCTDCARTKPIGINSLRNSASLFAESCNPVCGILQTRVAQSANLGMTETRIWSGPNVESGVAQSADQEGTKGPLSIKKENYKVQPQQTGAQVAALPYPTQPEVGSSSGVILPEKLLETELIAARSWLATVPDANLRQQVADEWAGLISLANRGVRPMYNRMGVLNTMIRRAKGRDSQPFVPTIAFEVAAARQREQALTLMRQGQGPAASNAGEPRAWAKGAAGSAALAEMAKMGFVRRREGA